MHAPARPYVMASAALAAVGAIAVTPIAPHLPEIRSASPAVSLVDSSSLMNVPLNLLYDLVNVPANELHAIQFFTDNLFMAGPWFVVSPTNLWGVDPGDPTHFMSVTNFLVPFPALSGMNAPETDFDGGLGQQLWGFMAAELPTSAGCDALACQPELPVSPVTGMSGIDFWAWLPEILQRGATQDALFPLFANWINVPFNDLVNGYYFNPAFDGSSEPAAPGGGAVNSFDGWSSTTGLLGGQGIPGTTSVDGVNYMPWSGETYTLQPLVPFENFFNSLMAPPPTDGLGGTGIDPLYADPTEIGRIFQAFLAGNMMFDPFTPGSPFCQGTCSNITDYPALIQDINNAWPGNPVIQEWLNDYANGTANVPSAEQIANSIALLQNNSFWDFQNPSPPDNLNPYAGDAQFFHDLWQSMGFTVPDLNTTPYDPAGHADAAAAAAASINPTTMLNTDTNLAADIGTLGTLVGMSDISAFLSQLTADLTAQLQADLTAMLASVSGDLPADIASQLSTDLLTLF